MGLVTVPSKSRFSYRWLPSQCLSRNSKDRAPGKTTIHAACSWNSVSTSARVLLWSLITWEASGVPLWTIFGGKVKVREVIRGFVHFLPTVESTYNPLEWFMFFLGKNAGCKLIPQGGSGRPSESNHWLVAGLRELWDISLCRLSSILTSWVRKLIVTTGRHRLCDTVWK